MKRPLYASRWEFALRCDCTHTIILSKALAQKLVDLNADEEVGIPEITLIEQRLLQSAR